MTSIKKYPAKGIGENEGRMIIAATEDAEEQNQIHINLENKKICFTESEFAAICAEMVQTYGRGSFKKGSYYSISGTKVDRPESGRVQKARG